MSTQGNVAVVGQMAELLKFMDEIKDLPAQEQVRLLRKRIEKTKAAADAGWL